MCSYYVYIFEKTLPSEERREGSQTKGNISAIFGEERYTTLADKGEVNQLPETEPERYSKGRKKDFIRI